jgi:putative phosphoesterase
MRLAVLSDIHGNRWALESVLSDAEEHRPDRFVVLGDLVADGPDPVGTLERLQALPNAMFVQGNTDRYLADLSRLVPPRSEFPDLVATWQWAVSRIGDEGRRFLADLPNEARLDTPAGQVLATHGVPGDDERGVNPKRYAELDALRHCGARTVFVGHTHSPFVLDGGYVTVINPGSVGISPETGWRASYAVINLFTKGRIAVQHVQVVWDISAFVRAFENGIPVNRKAVPMLNELRRYV